MQKELFTKAINLMEELTRQSLLLDSFLRKEWEGGPVFPHGKSISMIEELLSSGFSNSSMAVEWISYYCWELDFGKSWAPGTIRDCETDTDISLSTPEELYEFLVKEDQIRRGN